ncbi:MAG: peptidoglycan-binding protein [Peptococcaceae bacterium]|nr:peptidoglycan-binding protein [Peptococcaceae bacterium]
MTSSNDLTVSLPDTVCPYPEPTHELRIGSEGKDVSWLQCFLNQNGADLIIDGIFGVLTEIAVRKFQSRNGLLADGIVGAMTLAKSKGLATMKNYRAKGYPLAE